MSENIYWYGMIKHEAGYNSEGFAYQPREGWIYTESDPTGEYLSVIGYNRKLPDDDVLNYGLVYLDGEKFSKRHNLSRAEADREFNEQLKRYIKNGKITGGDITVALNTYHVLSAITEPTIEIIESLFAHMIYK